MVHISPANERLFDNSAVCGGSAPLELALEELEELAEGEPYSSPNGLDELPQANNNKLVPTRDNKQKANFKILMVTIPDSNVCALDVRLRNKKVAKPEIGHKK